MQRKILVSCILIFLSAITALYSEVNEVYVIPIKGEISNPQLYILRRGLKQAIEHQVKTVILDIDTPGGELHTTLEMMEALKKYDGKSLTYVNKEAISAGAYIAATTDEIFFNPEGVLGAAAVIEGTGADLAETLKAKVNSYLRAKIRTYTQEHPYRAEVIRAMMDEAYILKINNIVIKDKGELLTLTANEAIKAYGKPPAKLLATGIAQNIDDLLTQKFGSGNYKIVEFKINWSEELAKWLNKITPLLLGLGLMLLFMEFKTPGFGLMGISGIGLLLAVFASHYVAGIAGNEVIAVLILGLLLITVEVMLFPGLVLPGLIGLFLVFGSILWALADIWPNKDFKISLDLFVGPLADLLLGIAIAIIFVLLFARFFGKTWLWDQLILKTNISSKSNEPYLSKLHSEDIEKMIGLQALVTKTLHPSGEIELNGTRLQAHVGTGIIEKGELVIVLKNEGFSLLVKKQNKK